MNGQTPQIGDSAPVGELEARWEKRAEELEFEALGKVRGAAEKWVATLSGLFALVGTILLVKGPDEVAELPDGAQRLIGILLAIAFILAVVATVFAAYAAQGTPERLERPSGTALRRQERESAETAKTRLSRSRFITLVAVFLVASAVAAAWVWPAPENSGSSVIFTPVNGTPLCGALVNDQSGLAIEVDKMRTPLPDGPYDNVVPVDDCPSK